MSDKDPVQPVVPHLMIGRQATGAMRCASSQHALSPTEQGSSHSSGSSRFDRNGALVPLGHQSRLSFESQERYDPFDCGETRCVHHTVGRLKFAALAIHATELRLRRNIPTSVTLLTDLRRRCANTELSSVCDVTFKLRGNRQGESIPMTAASGHESHFALAGQFRGSLAAFHT